MPRTSTSLPYMYKEANTPAPNGRRTVGKSVITCPCAESNNGGQLWYITVDGYAICANCRSTISVRVLS